MNSNSVITITFGDVAENHAGMEKIGHLVDNGNGFTCDELNSIKEKLQEKEISCDLYDLGLQANVLVIRNGVQEILQRCCSLDDGSMIESAHEDMFQEHLRLNVDKQAFMYGRVVNKHARWNLCFDDFNREPNYAIKQGRIVSYNEIPITHLLREQFVEYFGDKAANLKAEGNYYYDITKCGIGFHGDSERRKVIGVRLGTNSSKIPLIFQWYYGGNTVNKRFEIPINGGDIYIMSEKAVGTDWKRKNIYTLRHATGCPKFTMTT